MSTSSSSGKKSPKRQPPAHLSEFYSYVNGNSNYNNNYNTTKTKNTTNGNDEHDTSHHQYDSYGIHSSPITRSKTGSSTNSSSYLPSHNKTESYDGSSSFFDPTKKYGSLYSTRDDSVHSGFSSISPSTLDLEVLITKKDVEETVNSYHDLIKTAKEYKAALVTLSNAASEFGRSLENCARCKGSGKASDGLMTASGLHHLIANRQLILSESVSMNFEKPVLNIMDQFDKDFKDNDVRFKSEIKEKVAQLKHNERANLKMSKKKTRNIVSYKSNLLQLASQLDEIDRLKHDYYVSSFDKVQDSALKVLAKASSLISVETTMYEHVAKKAWTGGGLDELLDTYVHDDPLEYDDEDSVEEVTIRDESENPLTEVQTIITSSQHLADIPESPNEEDAKSLEFNKTTLSKESVQKSILDIANLEPTVSKPTTGSNFNGKGSLLKDLDSPVDDTFYSPPITSSKLGSSHNSNHSDYQVFAHEHSFLPDVINNQSSNNASESDLNRAGLENNEKKETGTKQDDVEEKDDDRNEDDKVEEGAKEEENVKEDYTLPTPVSTTPK
ncbi:unnamed protein product [Ambrosiozyma monospora]|uniref:Unnamed protein product n=1 Tax=Ambrosiozyma monospora TaxID=43982 RepID=A0A9W6YM16_AMBMO|nr:unnamed protein product [Ambrosiozyma monospora]